MAASTFCNNGSMLHCNMLQGICYICSNSSLQYISDKEFKVVINYKTEEAFLLHTKMTNYILSQMRSKLLLLELRKLKSIKMEKIQKHGIA